MSTQLDLGPLNISQIADGRCPAHASDAVETETQAGSIDLLWIPLGAGGSGLVRLNGRVYEQITALRERRPALDLYHTALQVRVPEGDYVIETMWPSPPGDPTARGVVVEAPVFSRAISRLRLFRCEVRRWRAGVLADADQAVGGPQRVSCDLDQARGLVDLVPSVPPLMWGRDENRVGEMWNSNAVTSWLLTRVGLSVGDIRPPSAGRAPGWDAGVAVARGDASGCARSGACRVVA